MEDATDLMPVDGEAVSPLYLSETEEQKEAENEDRAAIQGAAPLLDRLFAFFDAQIDLAQTLAPIDLKGPQSIEVQVLAQKMLVAKLKGVKMELDILKRTYVDRK